MERKNGQKRSELRRRGLALALVCFALVGLVVVILLRTYQVKNEQLFYALVEQNLVAHHQTQVKDVQRDIQETEDLLEIVAAAYSATGLERDFAGWSGEYFSKAHELHDLDGVRYFSVETLEEQAAAPTTQAVIREIILRLLGEEAVVSDVFLSTRLEGRDVFSVSVPVVKDGRVVGALQSLLDAELLLGKSESQRYDRADNYLMLPDGMLILDSNEYLGGGEYSLYDDLEALEVPEEQVRRVRDILREGSGELVALNILGEGKMFLTASPLGYNDWILLSLAYSHDVKGYTTSMRNNSIMLVLSLLAFLALVLGTALWLIGQQRKKLAHNQARYDLLAKFSDTILFEYDCGERSVTFTPNIADRFDLPGNRKIYPYEDAAAAGVICPEDRPVLAGMLERLEKLAGDETGSVTIRLRGRDGAYRWINCQGQMLRDGRGKNGVLVGKLLDVHEQKSIEEHLLEKSSTDAMTGALNREAAQAQIAERLTACESGFLFMLDVDDFKTVNDSLGHAAGDRLLVHFVEVIKNVFRQEDVVGRIGGDEFVIFMSGSADRATAARKAQRLLEMLARWEEVPLSASIGVAAFPADGESYDALYRSADAAMYQAKRRGKRSFCFSDGT